MVELAKRGSTDVLALLAVKSDFSIAHKRSVFKLLFGVGDDHRDFASDYTERNIHLADIISALIDAGYQGKRILQAIKEFPPAISVKAVLSHLILKRKHSLFRHFFSHDPVDFDVVYLKLALENDAFASLFMLVHAFPMEFTECLDQLTESVLTSLRRSVRFYELKLFFLVRMLHLLTYRQTEEALLSIKDRV